MSAQGPRQWTTRCQQCRCKIHYSEHNLRLDLAVGQLRPRRCLRCQQLDERGLKTAPLTHAWLPAEQFPEKSPLGALPAVSQPHRPSFKPTLFRREKFGVQDTELQALYAELLREDTPVVIAVAPTGSGKSTFLPLRLLQPAGWPLDRFSAGRQIVITQPRRDVTIGIASYVAQDLYGAGVGPGHEVGYRVRGQQACDWRNRMVYVTDGSLVNWIARGELDRISLIVIDEAHERSLNIDIILGLLLDMLPLYPHLKVLIVSATIDHEKFRSHFTARLPPGMRCGVVECSGTKPVGLQVHYRSPGLPPFPLEGRDVNEFGQMAWEELANAMVRLIVAMDGPASARDASVPRLERGDVLGFLHGADAIDDACDHIRQRLQREYPELAANTDVYPYYAAVPQELREQAVCPKRDPQRRRVVIATNAAETSLTIESLVHVVESGIIKQTQWDPRLLEAPLLPVVHSQAGCRQRWGRVGRITAGFAWCLYTKAQFEKLFPRNTVPEIQRACLDGIVLVAKRAGATALDGQSFAWLDAPAGEELQRSVAKLTREGALDRDEDLTDYGLEIAKTGGEDALYSRLLRDADRFGLAIEVATLLPLLKSGLEELFPDDRDWDAGTRQRIRAAQECYRAAVTDDLELVLRAYEDWNQTAPGKRQAWAQRYGIDISVLEESVAPRLDIIRQLGAKKKTLEDRPIDFAGLDRLRILIARAFPDAVLARQGATSAASPGSSYRVWAAAGDASVVLEFSRASCSRATPPARLIALGPRKRLASTSGDRMLLPFSVSLDRLPLPASLDLTDLELALFFQDACPRPRSGSEADQGLQQHQWLRASFPPGSIVSCRIVGRRDDQWEVEVVGRGKAPPRITERVPTSSSRRERQNDAREAAGELRYPQSRRAAAPQVIDETAGHEEVGANEPFTRWKQSPGGPGKQPVRGWLTARTEGRELAPGDLVNAEVLRPTDLGALPALVLRSPSASESFAAFAAAFTNGSRVQVRVLGTTPAGAPMAGLLVRELTTGWETIVPSSECVLYDERVLLDLIPPGTLYELQVLDICRQQQSATLTALPRLQELLARQARAAAEPLVGTILRVGSDDRNVYLTVQLDSWARQPGDVVPVKLRLTRELFDFQEETPAPFSPGQKVHVSLEEVKQVQSRSPLPVIPAETQTLLRKMNVILEDGRLVRTEPLRPDQRLALRQSLPTPAWQLVVDELYQSGCLLKGRRIVSQLEEQFPVRKVLDKARVVEVNSQYAKLALEGGVWGILDRSELSWWNERQNDPRRLLAVGQELSVRVVACDPVRQTVQVSLKRVLGNSWVEAVEKEFPRGKRVVGSVSGFHVPDDGTAKLAFVNLTPGLDGGLFLRDMKSFHPGYIADVRDLLARDDQVEVTIIEVDGQRQKINLKLLGKLPRKAGPPSKAAPAHDGETELTADHWPWTAGENAIVARERPRTPPPPQPAPRLPLAKRPRPDEGKLSW
ncbi:MAG: DEAD/DEAH box helicase [Pirellulales bacterium]